MQSIATVGEVLPTKTNITDKANELIELVKNGEVNALEVAIKAKAIIATCEEFLTGINEDVLAEIGKYGKKANVLGAIAEVKEVGTKWDYSNSEAWVQAKKQEDSIAEKRKQVEAMAKTIPAGTEVNWTDAETGETFTVAAGAKSSKTSFAITLGK